MSNNGRAKCCVCADTCGQRTACRPSCLPAFASLVLSLFLRPPSSLPIHRYLMPLSASSCCSSASLLNCRQTQERGSCQACLCGRKRPDARGACLWVGPRLGHRPHVHQQLHTVGVEHVCELIQGPGGVAYRVEASNCHRAAQKNGSSLGSVNGPAWASAVFSDAADRQLRW